MLVSTSENDFYLTRISSVVYRKMSRTRLQFLWYDCTVAIMAFSKPVSQQDRANATCNSLSISSQIFTIIFFM
jgi:hypothetical protein